MRESYRMVLRSAMRGPAAGARRPPLKVPPEGVAHSGVTGGLCSHPEDPPTVSNDLDHWTIFAKILLARLGYGDDHLGGRHRDARAASGLVRGRRPCPGV